MNIVAYISSLNDKQALKRCIYALLCQTYPVGEIIVVDNRSSDGTPLETFPERVTLICHLRNLGTSGAVATAFQYALAKDYEWIWVLDQDTIPKANALEKLVELYRSFSLEHQQKIGILSSLVVLSPSETVIHGRRLTRGGTRPTRVDPTQVYYECDATIWSGSMYNLKAVQKVGLPRFGTNGCWEDFSLDYGDLEFSFRIKRAGYRVIGHNLSHIVHPVGKTRYLRFFTHTIFSTNHSAFRRYLYFRNMVYFWMYLNPNKNLFAIILYMSYRFLANCSKILLLEENRWRKIHACLLGIWDGLQKHLHHHYYFNA